MKNIEFRLAAHSIIDGRAAVEVWSDGTLMGAIYPSGTGIKFITKHPLGPVKRDEEDFWGKNLTTIGINFA